MFNVHNNTHNTTIYNRIEWQRASRSLYWTGNAFECTHVLNCAFVFDKSKETKPLSDIAEECIRLWVQRMVNLTIQFWKIAINLSSVVHEYHQFVEWILPKLIWVGIAHWKLSHSISMTIVQPLRHQIRSLRLRYRTMGKSSKVAISIGILSHFDYVLTITCEPSRSFFFFFFSSFLAEMFAFIKQTQISTNKIPHLQTTTLVGGFICFSLMEIYVFGIPQKSIILYICT